MGVFCRLQKKAPKCTEMENHLTRADQTKAKIPATYKINHGCGFTWVELGGGAVNLGDRSYLVKDILSVIKMGFEFIL